MTICNLECSQVTMEVQTWVCEVNSPLLALLPVVVGAAWK